MIVACANPIAKPANYASPAPGAFWQPREKDINEFRSDERLVDETDDDESFDYNALSLSNLVDIALQNNQSTKVAWASAKAAAAVWGGSLSTYLPTIEGTGSGAAGKIPLTMGSKSYLQAEAVLSYLLFDFGRRKATAQSAKQALIAANWNHNQTIQDVLRNVPQAFHTYIGDKANLVATKKSLEEAQTSLKAAELRKRSGLATIADVLQAKADLARVRVDLAASKGAVHISKGNLANVIGWSANANFDVKDGQKDLPFNNIQKDVNNLIETAKNERAAILSSLATVRQKEAELKKSKERLFSNINWIWNCSMEWQ